MSPQLNTAGSPLKNSLGRYSGSGLKYLRGPLHKNMEPLKGWLLVEGCLGGGQDGGAPISGRPVLRSRKQARLMRTLISVKAYQLELIYISDEKG